MTSRPEMYRFHNGEKAPLQFAVSEYEARIAGLRKIMADTGVSAAVFTSMHNISYSRASPTAPLVAPTAWW